MTMTREEWLVAFTKRAKPHFEEAGYQVPENIRMSVGFPSTGRKGKRIGECWSSSASKDEVHEIFIHPTLDDSSRVAGVLTHEIVHAVVGLDKKHGPVFKACATAMGLEGKMTATTEGPEFHKWAGPILDILGPIPHGQLNTMVTSRTPSESANRHIKCECSCGVKFRMSRTTIESMEGIRCPDAYCDGEIKVS
jgi:hypothetical protein